MDTAIQVAIDATLITLILALVAFGLAIIYGLIGVINLGHGAMLTLGAYFTWYATVWGVPFIPAVLLAATGVGAAGLVLEHLVIRKFYDRPFETLLLTWAFFLIVTELIKIIYGTDFKSVPNPVPQAFEIGEFRIPAYRAVVAVVGLIVMAATAIVFYRTNIGIRVRALIQDRNVASLLGLNIAVTYKLVFFAGSFMAGLAGALISPLLSIDPYMGNTFLVRSFFVVLVGGMGQLFSGTMAGAFFTGGTETFFSLFSSQAVSQTIVFALAILILRFRPSGIVRSR